MSLWKLCKLNELEEESSKGFTIDSELQVFVVKKEGELYVYKNQCPHLGIPLEMMPDQFLDLEKQFIQCSTHGALFEINNGFCVAGPCSGTSLQAMEFELVGDEVHLKI